MRLIDAEALIQDAEPELTWEMLSYINRAETVDAEPVGHGAWLDPDDRYDHRAFLKCSECGENVYLAKWMDYCPKCGAKMDGE